MTKEFILALSGVLCVAPSIALSQTMYLKRQQGVLQSEAKAGGISGRRVQNRTPGKSHRIVLFPVRPGRAEMTQIRRAGGDVIQSVPPQGLLVVAPEHLSAEDLGGLTSRSLTPLEKWSPLLEAAQLRAGSRQKASKELFNEKEYFLVEFFPDVAPGDAREIATSEHLIVRDHPDILSHHLVVYGSPEKVRKLTDWDEVAYVSPAAQQLIDGTPVFSCAGAVTLDRKVGQYVDRVGEGWDGPGLGDAVLSYYIGTMTSGISESEGRSEIERALNEWARYVQLRFLPASQPSGVRQLDIRFVAGDHGDRYSFDGPGGIVAHTFYPFSPNPEPIAGDIHLDATESWNINTNIDLYSVVLHELGHALGLAHSDQPTAVMYPYYRRAGTLSADDIAGVRSLYATRQADSAPSMSVYPSLGTSSSHSFSFSFPASSVPEIVNVLINDKLDGRGACYMALLPQTRTLVLVNDSGDAGGPYAGVTAIPGPDIIGNGQCTIDPSGARVSVTSEQVTLENLAIKTKPTFAPSLVIYLAARFAGGTTTGWRPKGLWRRSILQPTELPSVQSLDVSSAATNSFTLTTVVSAPADEIGIVNLLVNDAVEGRNACYLAFIPSTRTLVLVNDAGAAGGPFSGSLTLPGSGSIENSQCIISAAGSQAEIATRLLSLALNIRFGERFKGDRIVYVAGRGATAGTTGWLPMGIITVE